MRWDWESVAKRGSRLVGEESMRKVSEEGSEKPRREQAATRKPASTNAGPQRWRRLPRRGIGDFTENGGATGARSRREVRSTVVESFIGKEGEGESLFGIDGDAELRRGKD